MTREFGLAAFGIVWIVLLAVAVFGQVLLGRGATRKAAGAGFDFLSFIPFVLVFALASLPPSLGIYQGNSFVRAVGVLAAAGGLASYIISHVYLRGNWSITASIREGQELVTTGLYSRVRHPMYASMVLITLGSGLLIDNYFIVAAVVPVAAVYYFRAQKEEELLREVFPEYVPYAAKTRMFVPALR